MVGAVFLGAVADAMLLGHWYLVQPGLRRDPIRQIVLAVGVLWPFEVLVWLLPTGMVSVLSGTIDDGYGGLIGWMWVVACLTTIGLVVATWQALKEPSYSAVMAATGLMYLAILTGSGMELLPPRCCRSRTTAVVTVGFPMAGADEAVEEIPRYPSTLQPSYQRGRLRPDREEVPMRNKAMTLRLPAEQAEALRSK